MIDIETLSPETENSYEFLNRSSNSGLIYGSIKYKLFLQEIFPHAEAVYFLAKQDGKLCGALPCYLTDGPYGPVINSLPFFGSHGGLIISPDCPDPLTVKTLLINALDHLARSRSVVTTTIISNPLISDDMSFYDQKIEFDYTDYRIGQITALPSGCTSDDDIERALMEIFHQKTRNVVRKSKKGGFSVRSDRSEKAFHQLFTMHVENLSVIGGISKSIQNFLAIKEIFSEETDYNVFLAHRDGETAAALLLFYYNGVVEYFTPAINNKYRSEQVLSFLIFEAMKDACRRGMREWNWGGTWQSQTGVYLFKTRWGARDLPYRYYIREYASDNPMKRVTSDKLLLGYPGFYTLPFSELANNG